MTTETQHERLLTRAQLAAALTEAGFKTSVPTLATFASRGCGPAYRSYGRTPLYSLRVALKWAVDRTAAPSRLKFDAQTASQTMR